MAAHHVPRQTVHHPARQSHRDDGEQELRRPCRAQYEFRECHSALKKREIQSRRQRLCCGGFLHASSDAEADVEK